MTALYWRDPDGRHWSLPDDVSRVEAEAMAVASGPGWSVVELDVQAVAES